MDLKDIRTDEQVQKAMGFLQQYVGGSLQNVAHWLYFLWSLERVCVTYEFKDVNGVDWYDWGSRILLRYQHKDGYWSTTTARPSIRRLPCSSSRSPTLSARSHKSGPEAARSLGPAARPPRAAREAWPR